jgi:hypothetical protein
MKLLAICLTTPMLSMIAPVESLGLRSLMGDDKSSSNKGGEESETAIAPDQGERGLLSPWCDPSTPTLWHPDYTVGWSVSGCVYKADCNQVGSATEAECCAQYYGGQTGGLCTAINAASTGSGGTKWYADYGTAWPTAGCKSDTPYPIYASTFYDTELDCCKGAYAGQSSGACLGQLASPPTTSPTATGASGTDWYADYGTSWSVAGCKNTLPRPTYAIQLYATELECCKAAYGGQTSEACIQELPNPPTKSPSKAPTLKPTSSPSKAPTSKPTATPSKAPTSSPSRAPTNAPACTGGGSVAPGGSCSSANLCCVGACSSATTALGSCPV